MPTLIDLQDVSYKVPFGKTVIQRINLNVQSHQFVGVLGRNGCGKTTLMDLILGLKQLSSGTIQVLGEDPYSFERKFKSSVVFLSQDITLKGDAVIGEFLKFHSAFFPRYSKEEEAQLLDLFELKKNLKIGSLSTGQQKKVQIISNLATCPQLILIDEITAVLDPEARSLFFAELQRMKKTYGTSILLATNIAEDLHATADQVLFVDQGTASLHGADQIKELFNLEKVA